MPNVNEDYALFLDFDGTLVDIVERPDAVAVDPDLPDILTRLEQRLGGALAIISGRPVDFLDGRLVPQDFMGSSTASPVNSPCAIPMNTPPCAIWSSA